MRSVWYRFIDDYKDQIPYKPLSTILESYFWYLENERSEDEDAAYKNACKENVNKLMNQ